MDGHAAIVAVQGRDEQFHAAGAEQAGLQVEARAHFGRGRYSLWTGDIGLAVYLWDCVKGEPRFPTIDVF